jgi:hypothetical protein
VGGWVGGGGGGERECVRTVSSGQGSGRRLMLPPGRRTHCRHRALYPHSPLGRAPHTRKGDKIGGPKTSKLLARGRGWGGRKEKGVVVWSLFEEGSLLLKAMKRVDSERGEEVGRVSR